MSLPETALRAPDHLTASEMFLRSLPPRGLVGWIFVLEAARVDRWTARAAPDDLLLVSVEDALVAFRAELRARELRIEPGAGR